jgi:hypothetical protein
MAVHITFYTSTSTFSSDGHQEEFQRFFAKLVCFEDETTTQQILTMHKALVDATQAALHGGFVKHDNWGYCRDTHFIGGHQIEFFKIKPLLRALIIIIAKNLPEEACNFEELEVRLVRTRVTEGLSQRITFDGLTALCIIDENEIITTLPEAVRFIIDLDQREEAFVPKRDPKVIEHYLGLPKAQINQWRKQNKDSVYAKWTGSDGDFPVGPSTSWWKDGLITDEVFPKLLPTVALEESAPKRIKIS